ncbi:PH domain-containing protein [Alkalicoccus daliensis]|uniref:Putative membrane protein n=1 Tax=Alkalicoccus daliensis TaxID=745820 RepID=A0A1H0AR41_9BACI|nr:PH domain-containing protein [Alkalicoccus daliensis]SDN35794.1 putative membrane protein [Alkalicoccus daliensis]
MNNWQRQHPAAIFISFLNSLKQLIVTLVLVFIFGQTSQGMSSIFFISFFLLILFGSLISGFIGWWKFQYYLKEDELQVKQGLIFRKNRFIRRDRVQSIDINAKVIQRIFGLVELKIETAGGGSEPEFRLIALKRDDAELIKKELLEGKSASQEKEGYLGEISEGMAQSLSLSDYKEAETKEQESSKAFTWDLTPKRLIIAAITSSGVGIAATFMAAVISQVPQFLPDWLINIAIGWIVQSSIVYVGMFLVTVLISAWIFTIISTVLKYGMFSVTKRGKDIHISRGVLEQRQLTLYENRINAVRIVQNVLRQPFGYCAVYVESAGGGTKEEDLSTILLPLCKRNEVMNLLEELVPEYAFEVSYESLPKESMRRYMIKLFVPLFIAAGIITYFFSYGWLAFIFPIAGGTLGYIQYKTAGIESFKEYLCIRSRQLSKTEVFLPKRRIQDMVHSQNPLQRLDQLFTIEVSVLTTVVGKVFSLKHISSQQKENYMEWYSYEESTETLLPEENI